MRESNFAFPAQNKACVCITNQLYDRRALDTTSPLPLFNSLTHLTYLTSTSPRIREIMTMDGGLERLIRMLHAFCLSPPPPQGAGVIYGLAPPGTRPPRILPSPHDPLPLDGGPLAEGFALNPVSYDKHAAYRFSLAFQCVVNIGVRGSEPIRSRVVQAGALEVVGCILEAWLAGRGWGVGGAIGPPGASSSTTGSYRESTHSSSGSRRRRRDRGGGDRIERDQTRTERPAALDDVNIRPPREPEEMTPTSTVTPATVRNYVGAALAARTYAEQVQALARTRSGTIVLSNVEATPTTTSHPALLPRPTTAPTDTGSSINTTTPEASETEDDSDHVNMLAETPPRALNESEDVDMSRSPSPSPLFRTGRGVGNPLDRLPAAAGEGPTTGTDVEIAGMGAMLGLGGIAMEPAFGLGIGMGGLEMGIGIEGLGGLGLGTGTAEDDFAMGAPPGAPGALGVQPPTAATPHLAHHATGVHHHHTHATVGVASGGGVQGRRRSGPDETPRAGAIGLPHSRENFVLRQPSRINEDTDSSLDTDSDAPQTGDLDTDNTDTDTDFEGPSLSVPASASSVGSIDPGSARQDSDGENAQDGERDIAPPTIRHTQPGVRNRPPLTQVQSNQSTTSTTSNTSILSNPSLTSASTSEDDMEVVSDTDLGMQGLESRGARNTSPPLPPTAAESRDARASTSSASLHPQEPDTTGSQAVNNTSLSTQARGDRPSALLFRPEPFQRPGAPHPRGPTISHPIIHNARSQAAATVLRDHREQRERGHTRDRTVQPGQTVPLDRTEREREKAEKPPGPYRDEDVLLSLQLLAYLSKYPHVRQAFYGKREGFHPVVARANGGPPPSLSTPSSSNATSPASKSLLSPLMSSSGLTGRAAKSMGASLMAGKFIKPANSAASGNHEPSGHEDLSSTTTASSSRHSKSDPVERRLTNVFSLVERFTFRPSSSQHHSSHGTSDADSDAGTAIGAPGSAGSTTTAGPTVSKPLPRLPPEIQYWAGVIMRNACRKDDSRGGVRQCANMLCGRWESYPREFAKCRRCRKAKYCGKECQSTAWSEGHRFWCSAKDTSDIPLQSHGSRAGDDDDTDPPPSGSHPPTARSPTHPVALNNSGVEYPTPPITLERRGSNSTSTVRTSRRERERERDSTSRSAGSTSVAPPPSSMIPTRDLEAMVFSTQITSAASNSRYLVPPSAPPSVNGNAPYAPYVRRRSGTVTGAGGTSSLAIQAPPPGAFNSSSHSGAPIAVPGPSETSQEHIAPSSEDQERGFTRTQTAWWGESPNSQQRRTQTQTVQPRAESDREIDMLLAAFNRGGTDAIQSDPTLRRIVERIRATTATSASSQSFSAGSADSSSNVRGRGPG